jgi:hypothetical protein
MIIYNSNRTVSGNARAVASDLMAAGNPHAMKHP